MQEWRGEAVFAQMAVSYRHADAFLLLQAPYYCREYSDPVSNTYK